MGRGANSLETLSLDLMLHFNQANMLSDIMLIYHACYCMYLIDHFCVLLLMLQYTVTYLNNPHKYFMSYSYVFIN